MPRGHLLDNEQDDTKKCVLAVFPAEGPERGTYTEHSENMQSHVCNGQLD